MLLLAFVSLLLFDMEDCLSTRLRETNDQLLLLAALSGEGEGVLISLL